MRDVRKTLRDYDTANLHYDKRQSKGHVPNMRRAHDNRHTKRNHAENRKTPPSARPEISTEPKRPERPRRVQKLYARRLIFNKSGGRCWYCGEELSEDTFTVDHARPLSRGPGNNTIHNMVPACRPCNIDKANLDIFEFAWKLGDPEHRFAFEIHGWRFKVPARLLDSRRRFRDT